MDERDVGGRRKRRRGRGVAGKVPVFGLLKRGGKVYAKVIPNAKGKTVKAIIDHNIVPDRIVPLETFSSYNVLDVSNFKHYRINHSKLFADKKNHINGIEGFWSFAKHILYNYRSGSKYHFPMYLKEIEYRFNHRKENLFKLFLRCFFGYGSP